MGNGCSRAMRAKFWNSYWFKKRWGNFQNTWKDLVNKDHPQVVELWNLVYGVQWNSEGSLAPLKNKHVDTGMGLERLAMVLQGKNNYDTDVFRPIIDSLESISNKKYISGKSDDSQNKVNIAFRVIVDHQGSFIFNHWWSVAIQYWCWICNKENFKRAIGTVISFWI